MYQVILASALVAAAAALPAAPGYAAAPVYEEKPEAFAYNYGVADDYTNNNFQKTESQDEYGNVAGSYTIALPDGRIQTTNYHADNELGFVAEVTYEGTPSYPEAPKGGYGHAAPVVVAHAPVVRAHAPVVVAHAPVAVAHAPFAVAHAPIVPAVVAHRG